MSRFEGKTALITGAGRGIGLGIARCLAREGANLVINDIVPESQVREALDHLDSLGRQICFVQADVSDPQAVENLFARAIDRFGRIDIAVPNAAFSVREAVAESRWENVLRTLEVTQFGVFHVCRMAARHMMEQEPRGETRGKIVIIGSVHAEIAPEKSAAYNMAKAAVTHLGQTLAVELAPHRINVNSINPGWIDTPGERAFYTEEEIRRDGARLPWGRIGTIEDIGQAAAYLASEHADYVTGSVLRVDGGYVVARSTVD